MAPMLSQTDLFSQAITTVKALGNAAPVRLGEQDCTFHLPKSENKDDFHARELIIAAAHAIDPSVRLNESTMSGSLTFKTAYATFPSHQLEAKLKEIRRDVLSRATPDADSISIEVPADTAYPLGFVMRALLPNPTPVEFEYQLPQGSFRNGHGVAVSGRVDYNAHVDLIETAERENNYEASASLVYDAPCVGVRVTGAETIAALEQRIGASFAGGRQAG